MKFADGGYRPGYNVQFSTDTESGIIVGVAVVNEGSDQEQLPPMLAQIEERYDRRPAEALVDGGFASLDAIDRASQRGCAVYAPLKEEAKQLEQGKNPYARKKGDSDAVAAWRADGHGGGEIDLPVALSNGGMGQCPVPQSRLSADAGSRNPQMPRGGGVARHRSQYHPRNATAREGHDEHRLEQNMRKMVKLGKE